MINLLPPESNKNIRLEFFRRYIVVLGLGLFILMSTQIVLSVVSLFSISSYTRSLEDQRLSTKTLAGMKNVDNLEFETQQLNDLVFSYQKNKNTARFFSEEIYKVVSMVPSSVVVSSLLFDSHATDLQTSRLIVGGNADSRGDLIDFVDSLKASEYFSEVNLPLANLLSESDIKFTLSIDLKK
ncbi:PilN domain-containing protein [Patescibacteria group bacterium]